MTLFFLALAGLPPSLAGLMGKVYLFSSALSAEWYGLAIIAALNSALACAYYARVPLAIFSPTTGGSELLSVPLGAKVAISACVVAVIGFGLLPENLLQAVRAAAEAIVAQ